MKIRNIVLTCLTLTAAHFCFAQEVVTRTEAQAAVFKVPVAPEPLVILKSDTRTVRLDPKNNETFNFKAIDTQWIKSVTVLKGKDATEAYGESGSNGVLILQLVDNFVFSKPALIKLNLTE